MIIQNNLYDKIQLAEDEEIRKIPGIDHYFVSNYGRLFNDKDGYLKELSKHLDGKKRYWLVGINGKEMILHRLVALTFIPNPKNLPEVNHKDKNTQNPKADNLEWCTRKENLNDSYSTMSPVRNFNTCKLYENETLIGEFQSISKACRYAKKHYNASESSLSKYLKWNTIQIIPNKQTGMYKYEGHACNKSYNKSPVRLYKNGYFVKEFKTYSEMSKYYELELGEKISAGGLQKRMREHRVINGYEIKRN